MIFVKTNDITESDFQHLLENTKIGIDKEFVSKGIPKNIDGIAFERIVFEEMIKASANTKFQQHIEQTGILTFPDIIANKFYGVEVKMTVSDKWVSTGNSVLENTRKEDVETIYMFFGKFGKSYESRYRKYQDCLCEVVVTHSPRYKIDMELPEGKSIFDKIGLDYNVFRKEKNPIKRLKEYYKKQLKDGEELWWIDNTEESSVSPVVKSFRLLDESVKESFIIESMIFFPEIFGNSPSKFERPAAYLITNYNAVCSNIRDIFTAGGKDYVADQKTSQINFKLHLNAKNIEERIKKISKEKLTYYWKKEIKSEPLDIWKNTLEKHSKVAIDIFNKELEH